MEDKQKDQKEKKEKKNGILLTGATGAVAGAAGAVGATALVDALKDHDEEEEETPEEDDVAVNHPHRPTVNNQDDTPSTDDTPTTDNTPHDNIIANADEIQPIDSGNIAADADNTDVVNNVVPIQVPDVNPDEVAELIVASSSDNEQLVATLSDDEIESITADVEDIIEDVSEPDLNYAQQTEGNEGFSEMDMDPEIEEHNPELASDLGNDDVMVDDIV
jgi:archaellum component FlaG (FlaF/FlaG flagellin family)